VKDAVIDASTERSRGDFEIQHRGAILQLRDASRQKLAIHLLPAAELHFSVDHWPGTIGLVADFFQQQRVGIEVVKLELLAVMDVSRGDLVADFVDVVKRPGIIFGGAVIKPVTRTDKSGRLSLHLAQKEMLHAV